MTPTAAGYYYLGITQCCTNPLSSGGPIFMGLNGTDHLMVSGPTGTGGASPITGYTSVYDQTPGGGSYTIFLTGAQLAPAVPEPATVELMLAGLAFAAAVSRGRRKPLEH